MGELPIGRLPRIAYTPDRSANDGRGYGPQTEGARLLRRQVRQLRRTSQSDREDPERESGGVPPRGSRPLRGCCRDGVGACGAGKRPHDRPSREPSICLRGLASRSGSADRPPICAPRRSASRPRGGLGEPALRTNPSIQRPAVCAWHRGRQSRCDDDRFLDRVVSEDDGIASAQCEGADRGGGGDRLRPSRRVPPRKPRHVGHRRARHHRYGKPRRGSSVSHVPATRPRRGGCGSGCAERTGPQRTMGRAGT